MNNKSLTYRGNIQALVALDNLLLFVTTHPERAATALYRLELNGQAVDLSIAPLPCGGNDLACDGTNVWIAGQDGRLYRAGARKGRPKALDTLDFSEEPVHKLLRLADDHLALLQAQQLSLLNLQTNKLTQSIALSDAGTVMACDPSGHWLAVGLRNGEIAVCQYANGKLQRSSQAAIHQGRVSALQFEPNELRFYSAGADKKLFSTHAQGELQALDKGRGSTHDGVINAILMGSERFFTGANDKRIKAWAYTGGRPVTLDKGLGKITALATLAHANKRYLVAACTDDTLRIIPLLTGDDPEEVQLILRDAYAWARDALEESDPKRSEQALKLLAEYDDRKAFDLLTRQLQREENKTARQQIIKVAAASSHPESTKLLETALNDKRHDAVRLAAFDGLVRRVQTSNIRPYALALESGYQDIGTLALQALAKLATKQPQAEQALIYALQHPQRSLCLLALSLLEGVYAITDPKASLHALSVSHPELQRVALIRLYQRKLLDNAAVRSVILLSQESDDAWVRHTAFLIAILSRSALALALKECEPGLARQLQELEEFDLLKADGEKRGGKERLTQKDGKLRRSVAAGKLDAEDYTPLLQGMTCRHADICFAAAFALSVLQDQRAFGLLLLLSQEKADEIRVGVCRAFAWLQHPDALQQLEFLLDDKQENVRDAAFSALQELIDDPWMLVRYGVHSRHEEIHARALKALLDALGNGSKGLPAAGEALLKQALNDPFEAIRQETFKACLNRQLGGDRPATLRLLLSSRYENVHQEVLNVLLGNLKADWAAGLLYSLFDDDFASIRQEALERALHEKRHFDRYQVLERAVHSRFEEIRTAALQQLKARPGDKDWALIQGLMQDEVRELRLAALAAVITTEDTATLEAALESRYEDIQVNAAAVCARLGLGQAYDNLQQFASREKPQQKQLQKEWEAITSIALKGLALLGDERAFDAVLNHARSREKELGMIAAGVLPWISSDTHRDTLAAQLSDERPVLRAYAALALCLLGDARGEQILNDAESRSQLSGQLQMAATLSRRPVTAVALRAYAEDDATANSSILVLFSHELILHSQQPELSIRALSMEQPYLQRMCADLLSRYQDDAACWEFLRAWFTRQLDRNDVPDWQMPLAELKQIAVVLVHGGNHLRARLLQLLSALDRNETVECMQSRYRAFARRYADAIAAAESQVQTAPETAGDQQRWWQLAFGAYLGLLRVEVPSGNASATLNLRLQAMGGMRFIAEQGGETLRQSVFNCLLTLLNHPQNPLRLKALQDLKALGMPLDRLGNTATVSQYEDIAAAGLKLLVEHYPLRKSRKLLQDLVISGIPVLAREACHLLQQDPQVGLFHTTPFALQSYSADVRQGCVANLAEQYQATEARTLLLEAAQNELRTVALQAARVLAQHQHEQALQVLQTLWLGSEEAGEQEQLLEIMGLLREPGPAAFLLQCAEEKEILKHPLKQVYARIGAFRDASVAEALLERLRQRASGGKAIAEALRTISGYDQYIEDNEDDEDKTDTRWLERQHPRHDELLAELFSTLIKTDAHPQAQELLPGLQWMSASPAADNALADAVALVNDNFLQQLLAVIANRARRRDGSVAALTPLLKHKSPEIQFLAAEGLARCGRQEGNAVLLSAIEYMEQNELRIRAVLALGESGDPALLDKLLELAEDKQHQLQEAATEAIGHLAKSEQTDKILKLLQQALKHSSYYSDMHERALNGLRWFNTLDAWQTVGEFVQDEARSDSSRAHALKLLRHWDSQLSRDLLLKTLRDNDDYEQTKAAYHSACALWQPSKEEASPIDIAILQGHLSPSVYGDGNALERVCRYAGTGTLLELLTGEMEHDDKDAVRTQLRQSLLQREQQDTDTLVRGLSAERSETVALIAQLAARLRKPVKAVQQALPQALTTHAAAWQQTYREVQQQPSWNNRERLELQRNTLDKLLWTAVVQQVISEVITECLHSREKPQRQFQQTILTALLRLERVKDKALLEAVKGLLETPVAGIRQLAQQVMRQHANAGGLAWESFLHQPQVLVEAAFAPAITTAAGSDQQARVLPLLIRQQDIATLFDIAGDERVEETQRIGAIEGLGHIHSESAESHLQTLRQQAGIDQALARAAYCALRRSQRARRQASQSATATATQGDAV